MIAIMLLQALLFYFAAVYGGIEESLTQNAADILYERLNNRKSELETRFNNRWAALDDCTEQLDRQYAMYEEQHGGRPLGSDPRMQIEFLSDCADILIDTLRFSETNGIFLILNDSPGRQSFPAGGEQKYGLCIRDMDQDSNYSGREDLLLERAPSSIIDALGCSLDSWWEAKYSFDSPEDGDYYYRALDAAWEHPGAAGADLAYFSGVHRISGSDPKMVSYSLPLLDDSGYPYAVLGVELSVKYLSSLLPSRELNESGDRCCYVLAQQESDSDEFVPAVGTGALFNRCFGESAQILRGQSESTGGFTTQGRDGSLLYTAETELRIYNNNSPFESRRLVLLAMVEKDTLFSYVGRIKTTLMVMSLLSLLIGVAGLLFVSRRFVSPITALAKRVRGIDQSNSDYKLGRLGITEIDQLVDSIEALNRNVSRNSARTEFFSRMSHDMRTPMNAIISFSSPELLADADEALKDDYLDKIHVSGVYLLGLINEVLDMTKIESNKTELRTAAVPASLLFDTSIPIIEELARKKGIVFTSRIQADPELWVMADAQHLSQIVMNLLSNAVKFTPEGGTVRLTATIDRQSDVQPDALCRVVVADTGIGMSPEFMKNLYTPFEQENGRREGTGLGLSIAKKLVELMGGSIQCESTQNVGTTFTVSLPLCSAQPSALGLAGGGQGSADITLLRGKRVLVCEDNAINTRIIRLILERVGLLVDTAEDGRQGLELFEQSPPWTYDAILMDIRMPVMDGLEATKAIRALQREDAPRVPIIAMTANAFQEDADGSLAAGMNEHLSKPVETQKLYLTLLRYLY